MSPANISSSMPGASRRDFLKAAAAVTLGFHGLKRLVAAPLDMQTSDGWSAPGFGPLKKDPQGLLDLPEGFSYHLFSRVGEKMDDGLFVPGKPDGMAAFAGPNGRTILVRNHELLSKWTELGPFGKGNELLSKVAPESLYDRGWNKTPCVGGTTTLVYNTREKKLEKHFLSLAGTQYNCAGGPTPWGSWITCEENTQRSDEEYEKDHGYPFEVPASAEIRLARPSPIKGMGRFRREAIAVDPKSGVVYQTEDVGDGIITRYIPNKPGELLAGGRLQALAIRDEPSRDTRNWLDDKTKKPLAEPFAANNRVAVRWVDLDDVESPEDDLRKRAVAAGAAMFARGEGMWFGNDAVYFACTNGGRIRAGQVWRYVPSPFEGTPRESEQPGMVELFIEPNDGALVENCDNLTVSPWGDLVLCEDGPRSQYLVGVTPSGGIYKLALNAGDIFEFAGSCFSPDGSTLFVNVQGSGRTYAITGPWEQRKA
ncbi:MAG: DUF839 domain-containing protein [Phycisphaerae bacterium]|nr:DUF839 domain-containing protein [Phycisphaerae bacterium]